MAYFVIAGSANCIRYAEAEAISDYLTASLPSFKVHKILIDPNKWDDWLRNKCSEFGWIHSTSPLIWRELVARGSRGLYVGGLAEFLQLAQKYYDYKKHYRGIQLTYAVEDNVRALTVNQQRSVEAKMREDKLAFRICVYPSCSQTSAGVLHQLSRANFLENVSLNLYCDCDGHEAVLQNLACELRDNCSQQLISTNVGKTFDESLKAINVLIVILSEQSFKEEICYISSEIGSVRHNSQLKVLLCSPPDISCIAATLLSREASLPSENIVAVALNVENGFRSIVASMLSVQTADVRNLKIWGDLATGTLVVNWDDIMIENCDSSIVGPKPFSRKAADLLIQYPDYEERIFQEISQRDQDICQERDLIGCALKAAHATIETLRKWLMHGTDDGAEFTTVTLSVKDFLQLDDEFFLFCPAKVEDGDWKICSPDKPEIIPALIEAVSAIRHKLSSSISILPRHSSVSRSSKETPKEAE